MSGALGGSMTSQDLKATHATWETPISASYHGYDVYEFPPNTQRFAVLHRDIVARFGRFPHRNRMLGRSTTAEEQKFLDEGGFAG